MQASVALGHLFGSLISLDIIMYPNVNNLLRFWTLGLNAFGSGYLIYVYEPAANTNQWIYLEKSFSWNYTHGNVTEWRKPTVSSD